MSLQISIRETGDVAILNLRGRWTIDGGENELVQRPKDFQYMTARTQQS